VVAKDYHRIDLLDQRRGMIDPAIRHFGVQMISLRLIHLAVVGFLCASFLTAASPAEAKPAGERFLPWAYE
jgi:hypothetical protein